MLVDHQLPYKQTSSSTAGQTYLTLPHPQHWSPLLYSLYTYECVLTTNCNTFVKFAEDTVMVGLIFDKNEKAYLEEIKSLENW